jgi:hypothetical protein
MCCARCCAASPSEDADPPTEQPWNPHDHGTFRSAAANWTGIGAVGMVSGKFCMARAALTSSQLT